MTREAIRNGGLVKAEGVPYDLYIWTSTRRIEDLLIVGDLASIKVVEVNRAKLRVGLTGFNGLGSHEELADMEWDQVYQAGGNNLFMFASSKGSSPENKIAVLEIAKPDRLDVFRGENYVRVLESRLDRPNFRFNRIPIRH